ncbi:uncharacterized protein MONBRDRAFT_2458, partial [Monosiga brevicollis MX1]
VVLLAGPPGVGKTTLAHVVARHAGYSSVEINASDDRSPAALKERVINATQMQEVIGRDRRPNCLVLDEIDGASKGAINALIKIVQATGRRTCSHLGLLHSVAWPSRCGGKRKGALPALRRPIICICNDLQAPALRPLRQIALQINFAPIENNALIGRLLTICERKGVR